MTPSSNPLSMLLDIFRSPSACFLALYQRAAWGWQPYVVLVLSPFLFWGAYFDIVNFEWLKEGMTAYIDTSDPKQIELLDANTLMALEIITDIASRTVTIIILAFWLNLATKPSQHQHSFWRWFAVSSVIIFPAVIGDLASYVSVLLKHGEVMIYAADLNSLNGLIKLPPDHAWSQFASSFPLLMPWYIALGYGAVATWTEFQRDQALVISALPWVGYYFIWALYILIF